MPAADKGNMKQNTYLKIMLCALVLFNCVIATAATGPTLMMDVNPAGTEFTGGIGPMMKYKRVRAPQDFGGDMTLWGIRGFGGKLQDPEIGFVYNSGTLSGTALRFNLDMAGLTLEDSFREDSRVKWRVSAGVGKYKLSSKASGMVFNQGSFAFAEPMILGVLPMSRHIVLEFGAGYTFAGATGVRIEGLTLNAEILMGKF
jgi:hypothetical protein